ncbi:flagellar hook-length control protein FliK [Sphingomonas lenta]|uniref:Flagellar hook-length control protein-like C-terminal domain-containing protein n=1 Tax=Sphingomonas lenta TaxID=1141887 RepID=A0A2A2SFF3_9SPHN|nr:flagellar hook-length control protein FliK [Sphingomonas lenta]PAX07935.1 hypothetical protein CKY28_10040 [Sphingomonas lenta]
MIQPLSALTSLLAGKSVPAAGGDGQAFASSLAELVQAKPGGGDARQKTADPGSVLPEGDPDTGLALLAAVTGGVPPAPDAERADGPVQTPVPPPATRPDPMQPTSFPSSPATPVAPRTSVASAEPPIVDVPVPIARVLRSRPERPVLPRPAEMTVEIAADADPDRVATRAIDVGDVREHLATARDAHAPELVIPFAEPRTVPPVEVMPTHDRASTEESTPSGPSDRPVRFASVPLPQLLTPAIGPDLVPMTDPMVAPALVATAPTAAHASLTAVAAGRASASAATQVAVPPATASASTIAAAANAPTVPDEAVASMPAPVPVPSAPTIASVPGTPVASDVAALAPPVLTSAATAAVQPSTAPATPAAATGVVQVADVLPAPDAPTRQAEPRAVEAPARPVQAAPVIAPTASAPVIGPAVRMFAAEIHRASREVRRPVALDVAAQAFIGELQGTRPTPAAVVEAASAPLDVRHEQWPLAMVERIERLRDAVDASDTRIRLVPEALGRIDVSVKRDGDAVHVHFAAEQAATRAMLQEAQPKLAEAAEARGLKLGQTSVGGDGAERHGRHAPDRPLPSSPAPARARSSEPAAEDDTDHRIA